MRTQTPSVLGQNIILQSHASLLGFRMPKRRDGIMTVRIPTDEKDLLQAIADNADVTLSDAVVRAVRDFIEAHPVPAKAKAKK
jgi:hypothetical protein